VKKKNRLAEKKQVAVSPGLTKKDPFRDLKAPGENDLSKKGDQINLIQEKNAVLNPGEAAVMAENLRDQAEAVVLVQNLFESKKAILILKDLEEGKVHLTMNSPLERKDQEKTTGLQAERSRLVKIGREKIIAPLMTGRMERINKEGAIVRQERSLMVTIGQKEITAHQVTGLLTEGMNPLLQRGVLVVIGNQWVTVTGLMVTSLQGNGTEKKSILFTETKRNLQKANQKGRVFLMMDQPVSTSIFQMQVSAHAGKLMS
jgi:hypothetical protein